MANMKIKKGDKVQVIAGANKDAQGEVLVVMPEEHKVIVKDVNIVSKHKKPRNQTEPGGIIKQEAPLDASNVMVICPACKKPTKVAIEIRDGKKVRICKECKAVID